MVIVDVKPWDERVPAALLLDEFVTAIRRHLFLGPETAETIALWIAHTWVANRLSTRPGSPSPVRRNGAAIDPRRRAPGDLLPGAQGRQHQRGDSSATQMSPSLSPISSGIGRSNASATPAIGRPTRQLPRQVGQSSLRAGST